MVAVILKAFLIRFKAIKIKFYFKSGSRGSRTKPGLGPGFCAGPDFQFPIENPHFFMAVPKDRDFVQPPKYLVISTNCVNDKLNIMYVKGDKDINNFTKKHTILKSWP